MCTLRELYGPGVEKVSCAAPLRRVHRADWAATYRPASLRDTLEQKAGRQRRAVELPYRAHPIVSCHSLTLRDHVAEQAKGCGHVRSSRHPRHSERDCPDPASRFKC